MTTKRLKYLARHERGSPGEYPILSMQRSLDAAGVPAVFNATSRPVRLFARALARSGMMRQIIDLSQNAYFVPIMLLSEARLFPKCYFAETVVYIFDCWPALYGRWEKFFRRHRMRVAFFSARDSAEHFKKRIPEMESIWLPEAVEASVYRGEKPIEQRSIDVLELGRRSEDYHNRIVVPLAKGGRVHKFQSAPGHIIFPTVAELVAGFGDTKVSICFPSSMTHPLRSGNVETVTHRYFESMASRCIIVGHAPAELQDFFGYNPVVEADMNDAAGQIEAILRDPGAYASLVERNYQRLMEIGTWDARVRTMLELLAARRYAI
ncbi:MAG: hypothetical protein QOF78_354 [Phycisphaerales bacterium]|jgi:hypothetical protein|nr:hypothetical protein [Phycisphaerales bacterium]